MIKRTITLMMALIVLAGTAGVFAQDNGNNPERRRNRNQSAEQRAPRPDGERVPRDRQSWENRRAEMEKQREARKTWVEELEKALAANDREAMGKLIESMDKEVQEEIKQQQEREKEMELRRKEFEERLKKESPERYEAYMKRMKEREAQREAQQAREAKEAKEAKKAKPAKPAKDAKDSNDPNAPRRDRRRLGELGQMDFTKWFGDVKEAYKAEDNKKMAKLIGKWQKQQEELEKRLMEMQRERQRDGRSNAQPATSRRGGEQPATRERPARPDRPERPGRDRGNRNADDN